MVEAERLGWDLVRMRRWNVARADYDNLLFVKWHDGFEEVYDYDDVPYLYNGRVNSPREEQNLGMLRAKRWTAPRRGCWAG